MLNSCCRLTCVWAHEKVNVNVVEHNDILWWCTLVHSTSPLIHTEHYRINSVMRAVIHVWTFIHLQLSLCWNIFALGIVQPVVIFKWINTQIPKLCSNSYTALHKMLHVRLVGMSSSLVSSPVNPFRTLSASSLSHHPDPNGHVYQSVVSVRGLGTDEGAQALPLPRSLLLSLPVGDGLLEAASALVLDEAHVAVVGVPHPSAGAGKGKCCGFSFMGCFRWS